MNVNFTPSAPDAFVTDTGPFDLIGDVHGCAGELEALLHRLGYDVRYRGVAGARDYAIRHPEGRKPVLLGDLVDRGPRTPDVMRLAMHIVESGQGYCVVGNHDDKFRRWLAGRKVSVTHGLEATIEQFEREPDHFHRQVAAFIDTLPSHLILDGGDLVVAHAGLHADMHGEETSRTRAFAMYGEVTGERDMHGLPVRRDWARDYSGEATVVHGHVAEPEVRERNNVVCIDTGCVFGGYLTAMRWPEREFVQVPAQDAWFSSPKWSG